MSILTTYPHKVILASSSKYRIKLLSRLNIDFEALSPNIDESAINNEKPEDLVKRLALAKASVISKNHPNAAVIGSDQIAVFNNEIIGKPGNYENAFKQLQMFSGHSIEFHTGVALVKQDNDFAGYRPSVVSVKFKQLDNQTISDYLKLDKPFDCAGSFKVESYGINLFDAICSDDPTSLEGLPLINTCHLLTELKSYH